MADIEDTPKPDPPKGDDPGSTSGVSTHPGVQIAIFGVVALVLGLLGLVVSAQFEPLEPPLTIPIGSPSSTVSGVSSTTTTSGFEAPTTIPGAGVTTTPPTAANLVLDQTQIDFGDSDSVRSVRLDNDGGQPATWDATSTTQTMLISPSSGTLGPGESITIDLSLDRSAAPEGDLSESVDIVWQAGSIGLGVVGSNNVNPVLHNPQVSPSALKVDGCSPTQATVSVRVRDASPLSSVVVRWAGQETQMIDVGSEMWEGVIGPFGSAEQQTVRVVAFDEHGNAGGAAVTVDVTACP